MLNSIAQMLIRLTVPGVPDVYQGNDMWEFKLVDPDNRRVVDYGTRQNALEQIRSMSHSESQLGEVAQRLAAHPEDGCVKVYVLWRTLKLRNQLPELFIEGTYTPLPVTGSKAKHVVAFMRQSPGSVAVIAVPRLSAQLTRGELRLPLGEDIWADTEIQVPDLNGASLRDVFTAETRAIKGGAVRASAAFSTFPVALLSSHDAQS
jgi:(1->4)-alpha-D-glucan 1-alpha-D-glucosylmutase